METHGVFQLGVRVATSSKVIAAIAPIRSLSVWLGSPTIRPIAQTRAIDRQTEKKKLLLARFDATSAAESKRE